MFKKTLLLFVFGCVLTASAVCTLDEIELTAIRKTQGWAYDELWVIRSGNLELVKSKVPESTTTSTDLYCLKKTTDMVYDLELYDMSNDGWSNDYGENSLTILGPDGGIRFHGVLTEHHNVTYVLSFASPISKGSSMKFAYGPNVPSTWFTTSFVDTVWVQVWLNETASLYQHPHFFRTTFVGKSTFAAYELNVHYKEGIVIYLNGNQIFRDNLPQDALTASSTATSTYPTYRFVKVVRPGVEINASSSNVLAIGLYYTNSTQDYQPLLDFYINYLGRSTSVGNCYVVGDPFTLTTSSQVPSSSSYSPLNPFDLSTSTYWKDGIRSNEQWFHMNYTSLDAFYAVNRLDFSPGIDYSLGPTAFTFHGCYRPDGAAMMYLMSSYDTQYSSDDLVTYMFPTATFAHRRFKLSMETSLIKDDVTVGEIQMSVCNVPVATSIAYSQSTYTLYSDITDVDIRPTTADWTNCAIQPTSLPLGIYFDSFSCAFTGRSIGSLAPVTYTVTASIPVSSQTTVTLSSQDCESSTLIIKKKNGEYGVSGETFSLSVTSTQTVVFTKAGNAHIVPNVVSEWRFCTTQSMYTITMGHTSSEVWAAGSYIQVFLKNGGVETLVTERSYDKTLFSASFTIYTRYEVAPSSSWYYSMGSLPTNWYASGSVSGFGNQASAPFFPSSSNQIQVYKKIFSLTASSVTTMSHFMISLKARYGYIIYVNGNEVARAYLPSGTPSSSTMSNKASSTGSLKPVTMSIPVMRMKTDTETSIALLNTGDNTVAIALFAESANSKTSEFDCSIRLVSEERSWKSFGGSGSVVVSSTDSSASSLYQLINMNHDDEVIFSQDSASITIDFGSERREWINEYVMVGSKSLAQQSHRPPKSWSVSGKVSDASSDSWVSIGVATDMAFFTNSQVVKLFLVHNYSFRYYRFSELKSVGDIVTSKIYISEIGLVSDRINYSYPTLSYSSISGTEYDEIAPIYPNSDLYIGFSVSPALPTGLSLNPYTGVVVGSLSTCVTRSYTITATTLAKTTNTCSLSVTCVECDENKAPITVSILADGWVGDIGYKIFKGKGTSGELVISKSGLSNPHQYNDQTYCLMHNFFTIEFTGVGGWTFPASWELWANDHKMLLVSGSMVVTDSEFTYFSSFNDVQFESTIWKQYKLDISPASEWMMKSFIDSSWESKTSTNFGTAAAFTTYYRHTIAVPSPVSDGPVMVVQVKHTGGFISYFNGMKTAMFNMPTDGPITHTTKAAFAHNVNMLSRYHVNLLVSHAEPGYGNVLAFEVHRAPSDTTSSAIVFDAYNSILANECNALYPSIGSITSSLNVSPSITKYMFDGQLSTSATWDATQVNDIQFVLLNQLPTHFNAYALVISSLIIPTYWSIMGSASASDPLTQLSVHEETLIESGKYYVSPFPGGNLGFSRYSFSFIRTSAVSETGGDLGVSEISLMQCKYSAQICEATGDIAVPVGVGEVGVTQCPSSFEGYAYRLCELKDDQAVFGALQTDTCFPLPPSGFVFDYPLTSYNFTWVIDTYNQLDTLYNNTVDYFSISPALPSGLSLNMGSGMIYGTPLELTNGTETFTLSAVNSRGSMDIVFNLTTRYAQCKGDMIGQLNELDDTKISSCKTKGSYVGSMTMVCRVGTTDGVWIESKGGCMHVALLVFLIIVGVIVLAAIVWTVLYLIKTRSGGRNLKKVTRS